MTLLEWCSQVVTKSTYINYDHPLLVIGQLLLPFRDFLFVLLGGSLFFIF